MICGAIIVLRGQRLAAHLEQRSAKVVLRSLEFCLPVYCKRCYLKMTIYAIKTRLISTDATARGIDIREVNYIINYDAPQFIRTYVHR